MWTCLAGRTSNCGRYVYILGVLHLPLLGSYSFMRPTLRQYPIHSLTSFSPNAGMSGLDKVLDRRVTLSQANRGKPSALVLFSTFVDMVRKN